MPSGARKDKLVEQAEALADSTDWGGHLQRLPRADAAVEGSRPGRAGTTRPSCGSGSAAPRTSSSRRARRCSRPRRPSCACNAAAKEELLVEAQALLPVTDWRAAKSALRGIQERWEQAGPVPRESRDQLEQGLRKVEDAVKRAEEAQWKRSNPEALARAEATVSQLRTAIQTLEGQLAKAQARGDAAGIGKAEEAIAARRSWLVEAERTLAEFSS